MASAFAATVAPARRVRGRLRVPGDKSISHRYALLAALADGTSRLTNYAPGADCRSTLACLQALGVEIRTAHAVTIVGRGFAGWRSPDGPLDAGNSGTSMRLLAGLLAAQRFDSTLVGDESLSRRPMRRVIEPLARMGAQVAELSTAWVGPVKALLDEQQELIEALAAWSEQQRIIAERFAALAERNRALSAQTMAVLGPLLDGVESVGNLAKSTKPKGDVPPE